MEQTQNISQTATALDSTHAQAHAMTRLKKLAEQNGPLCVGIDTDISYFPENIATQFQSPADAVLAYNLEIIKRVAAQKSAACCKIQIAYYEALGVSGMKAFAETVRAVRESGLVAISDVKRGDIANTADAYARAHFSGEFETDIITVNPYMGFDTLTPFTDFCKPRKNEGGLPPQEAKAIFVLLRTSNPGARHVEEQELVGGSCVYNLVGSELMRLSQEFASIYQNSSCSPIGAVVGCTQESDAKELREKYADLFFLIPGYGAQGGAARVAATLLQKAGGVVNSSRAILCAWKKDETLAEKREKNSLTIDDMADAAARASLAAKQDLLNATASL